MKTGPFGFLSTLTIASLLLVSAISFAYKSKEYTGINATSSSEVPSQLEGVGITEHLGESLDLTLPVTDENGKLTTLGSFYDGQIPIIVSPVYFGCPGLCNFHLNGLTEALKEIDWTAGKKFKVLAISFDSREKSDVALTKKNSYLKVYGRPGSEDGWHFLTLDEAAVKAFTQKAGFRFKWNAESNEWSHASAAIVTSPTGQITRYLPGIVFDGKDVKLALNEATSGKIGNIIEGLVLYCFQYNTHAGKYALAAYNVMKLGGALMILVLGFWLVPVWLRTRRQQKTAGS